MKVVLFCGGEGLRIREYSSDIPKPMIKIGSQPILWHVMKYYAHHGHTEFILCLGYKGGVIKSAFLHHAEFLTNDFKVAERGEHYEVLISDTSDWKITLVDTGRDACVGERLVSIRPHLEDDDVFLATYADGVTDLYLPTMIDRFLGSNCIGSCLSVRPSYTFHVIYMNGDGTVRDIKAAKNAGFCMNGGYFIFRKEVFDYIREGEDLVEGPFQRLTQIGKLSAFTHKGFWACMDTFKEKMILEEIHATGNAPWEVWNHTPKAWESSQ